MLHNEQQQEEELQAQLDKDCSDSSQPSVTGSQEPLGQPLISNESEVAMAEVENTLYQYQEYTEDLNVQHAELNKDQCTIFEDSEFVKEAPPRTALDVQCTTATKVEPLKANKKLSKAAVGKSGKDELYPCFPASWVKRCSCTCGVAFWKTPIARFYLFLRRMAFKLVQNALWNNMFFAVTLMSAITLTLDDKYAKSNDNLQLFLRYLDFFYTAWFNVDVLIKITGLGFATYFTDSWMILEFCLTVTPMPLRHSLFGASLRPWWKTMVLLASWSMMAGTLVILGSNISDLRILTILRPVRALRPLRIISRWEGMRLVVNSLVVSIPAIANVMLVCLIFWLIFGILGVQLFGGKFFACYDRNGIRLPVSIVNNRTDCDANPRYSWKNTDVSFDNILLAYVSLFQVATFEGWMELMASSADARGIDLQPETDANIYSILYFVAFIVVGTFFILNLFIGVIIENFTTMRKKLIPVEHCGNTLRMSKATRKTTPRMRKQHFSDAELNMLAGTLAAHADLMKSHDMKREVQQKKKDIWQEVSRKVSAVGTTPRTVRDCCKRWNNLHLRVRNIMSRNRRAAMATGGGPHSPAKMMPWEETASNFIDPESIEGFGEMEMGAASSPEGGTDEENARQQNTARASTSHQKKRATATTTSMADKQATPTHSVPDQVETQPTTPAASVPDTHQTQQPTPTPVGGESLHAPATTKDDLDGNVDLEGVTEVACPPSPSPQSTPIPTMKEGPLIMLLSEDQRRLYSTLKRLTRARPIKVIPPPQEKCLMLFYWLVHSKHFEVFTNCLIIANTLAMAFDHNNISLFYSNILNWISIIFTVLFTIETTLKLIGLRRYYFTQAWNIFDIVIIALSIVGFVLESMADKINFSLTILRVFRVARLGRLILLIRSIRGIRNLLFTLIISIPALFNIALLLLMVICIYAILAMNLFSGLPRTDIITEMVNFETFKNSVILLFRLATAAGWNEILEQLLQSQVQQPIVCILFMLTYVLITFIVIINMYVAVILENFNEVQEQELSGLTDDDFVMFYAVWSKYDPEATEFITYDQLSNFLDDLKPPLKISKPNSVKIAALNIPVTSDKKLHCLDILKALSIVIIGGVKETAIWRELYKRINEKSLKRFPGRVRIHTITSTLMIWREFKAAITIQQTFRRWRLSRAIAASMQNQ
ncbi:sodium channel protein 1 brain-like [Ambystoma mexicanum]|uniref:sodium channel protein 1 brain-like n=1 Tax=Ambystoma mexicanum TaxID=8296 RepID=UPI0037E8D5CA